MAAKRVMWFSRHEMTPEQLAALGEVEVHQVDRTINRVAEIQEDIDGADILAIVAPINLQQQFLAAAGGRPVIMAVNARELIADPDGGESKAVFRFVKWEQLDEIVVRKHDFAPVTE